MIKTESKTPADKFDVIIIGAGPAGLSAALYTARRALKTLVLSTDIGGQLLTTTHIENYPGIEMIDGAGMAKAFHEQAKKWGAEFRSGEAVDIKPIDKNGFVIKTKDGELKSKAVILAFGMAHRKLGAKGEEAFEGKGVTYCATCDGPLFKGKDVIVVGGGNSALEAAEYLSRIVNKVYLLVRKDKFRGEAVLQKKVNDAKNIEVMFNSQVEEIKGENLVGSVDVKNNKSDKISTLDIQGVFIEIGFVAKTGFVKDLVKLNEAGEIMTELDGRTSTPGVFAAGDITQTPYKQIVISGGEGAKAALEAYKFITGKEVGPDWEENK